MTHSIRFKFIIFVLVIVVTLLLLLNTYPISSSRDMVFQEKRSSMSVQASVVSSALSSLDRLSREGVSDVFRFLDLSGFDRIVVIDNLGSILYDDGRDAPELEDLIRALDGKSVFRSVFADAAFVSSISVPIGTQNATTGAVALYENDTERAGIMLSIQQRIVILSLVIGVLALFLAVVFSWFVLRRLNKLTQSMNIVAGGDYKYRHTITGNDEISSLGREFNALTEQLETNETQRRRFVSDASHELKTPLASIRLLSDSILQTEQMDSETEREFVADIRAEADRLQRTTEKLLDLSRLDDGVQLVSEPVDLKQITLDTLPGLMPLARENRILLEPVLDDGCVIMANSEDMIHVIYNLVENAIKYNHENGWVKVVCDADYRYAYIRVADSGIGIPQEALPHVFERFYRVDKARSRERGGTGLGLSIASSIVLMHGGAIRVSSTPGEGSTFTVRIPVRQM